MEYAETATQRLESLWRAKVEAARLRHSDEQSPETRAAYRSVLKTFADLVLRGKAPEEAPTHMREDLESDCP